MFQIKANTEKNYLLIVLDGVVKEGEIPQAMAILHEETAKLQAGFTIINDISKFKVMKTDDAERVKQIQEWLYSQGAAQTIRVVDSVFAQAQFRKNQASANAKYITQEVTTLDEAYSLLH